MKIDQVNFFNPKEITILPILNFAVRTCCRDCRNIEEKDTRTVNMELAINDDVMRFFRYLLGGVLAVTLISCAGLENIDVGEIEDVNFHRFADRSIEFEVIMPIDNPSWFRFRIISVDLDVFINNEYVGKITNVDNVLIPSRSCELYSFPLKVEFSNILRGAISIYNIFIYRQADVRVMGRISARSFPITRSLNVDETTKIVLSGR